MRIDIFLAEKGMVRSRELAKSLIKEGSISVNGKVITKPSAEVSDNDTVEITGKLPDYVGRGGLKLEKAVVSFGIRLEGFVCADIGASTGGFTDCMLKNGAEYVYAVDVGHDQLAESLKNDPRVCNMEGRNIKDITKDDFDRHIDFISVDVSFISLTRVLPVLSLISDDDTEAVLLVKPQFECGKKDVGKNGIVKSESVHRRVLDEISACCQGNGFFIKGADYSPVSGGDGNIEYLFYVSRKPQSAVFDFDSIVKESHRSVR